MNDKRVWFLLKNQSISGPLTAFELEKLLTLDSRVWWFGGIPVSAAEWRHYREKIHLNIKPHFYLDSERHTPRAIEDMVDLIQPSLATAQMVKLYDPDAKRSYSIFESKALTKALGLPLRHFVRTEIEGSVLIRSENGPRIISPIVSLSAKGLSVRLGREVNLKGLVSVFIRSKNLMEVIPLAADVIYHTDGVVGLKINHIDPYFQDMINKYIRRKEGAIEVNSVAA